MVKPGEQFTVEDWWDRMGSGSWTDQQYSNWACKHYAARVAAGLPADNEVVYGKIGAFGHLIHVSELTAE